MLRQKNVYINVLNQGTVASGLVQALTTIIQQDSYRIGLDFPNGKPITNNRNTIVQKFLAKKEYDYLMMIDSDILPPPNILKLLDYQKDIIAPVMFALQKGEVRPLYLKMAKDGIYEIPKEFMEKTGLQEVDATGTGCIVISRKVLEKIKHPFENIYDTDGIKRWGNDFNFCKKAKKEGFKVFVHLDFVSSHLTTMDLKEIYYTVLGRVKTEEELNKLKKYFENKPKLLEKILSSPE
jgi:GT2 family glycosyltransferase